ncbi:MAG: nicotinamide-nucleotide amidohydrolase family protein [Bacteriovoracia bacterium]
MKVGLLVIGSEVLDGKISDLNTKILAEFLRPHHLEINEVIITRDDQNAIERALHRIFENDVIVTTGGLGPTKDDITKQVLTQFFNKKLIYNEEAERISRENYQRFNRPFPGKEYGYCYLPEGFIPLANSTGLAPGFYVEHEGKLLFSAPGVPRELKSMLNDHLFKALGNRVDKNVFIDNVIARTKNIPEEKIFGEVDPDLWDKLSVFGDVSSLPILMGVDIGVKITGRSAEEIASKVASVRNIFDNSPVKKSIWHMGRESIEEKIVSLANEKKIKFGFAESATGGLCSNRITNIPGSSNCFMGSVVSYDERIKEHFLGVKRKTLDEESAVSLPCAIEMAEGLKNIFSLDVAISITGFAGPGGGNEKFPVGSVCIGRALKNSESFAQNFVLRGDRELLKQRFSQAALYALLEEVEKFS